MVLRLVIANIAGKDGRKGRAMKSDHKLAASGALPRQIRSAVPTISSSACAKAAQTVVHGIRIKAATAPAAGTSQVSHEKRRRKDVREMRKKTLMDAGHHRKRLARLPMAILALVTAAA
jgi:hypothetical protein